MQQPVAGRPQKDIRLKAGEDNWEKQVSRVEFIPANGTPWQGGTPDAKLVDEDWTCNITAIQAWDDPDSFVRWCREHKGEQVEVEYKPHADNAFTLYATITIPAVTVGGVVNQRNESTLACLSTEPLETAPVVVP